MTSTLFSTEKTQSATLELPLVSVCITTYNQAIYIRQTLDGILSQKTTFPFEIVIGEDNGPDNTRAICEAYQEKYPHIVRVLDTPHNFGAVPNLARTIKQCRGRYVAVLDGDDYWIDDYKLQKQIDCLEKDTDMNLCFTGWKEYEDGTDVFYDVERAKTEGKFYLEDFVKNTYFHTSTVVFRQPKNQDWLNRFGNLKIGDRPLYVSVLVENGGYAYKLPDICSVFRVSYTSTFTPVPPVQRSILVAGMYAELKRLYPSLAIYLNHHLNVSDYFILRDAYQKNDRTEVKTRIKNILERPTKSYGWWLKIKTFVHYFI